jgi:hypothetical protein
MQKTIFYVICFFAIVLNRAYTQNIEWQNATNWRLFDTISRSNRFNKDSLNFYRYALLDNLTMQRLLTNTDTLPSTAQGAAWMGFYRISCTIHDTTRLLFVSKYGGFFADVDTKQYFQIPIDNVREWNAYFDSKFSELHKNLGP